MNRIKHLSSFKKPTLPAPPQQVQQALLSSIESRRGRVSFFAPMHYEANYAYPLLVWLHGPRDDERQLLRVMPLISMRNYAAVAPRGCPCPGSSALRTWCQTDSGISHAEQSTLDAVEAAREKFNLAADRIFLAGYACGGTMAFRIGMKYPDCFAGILSLGGPFPLGQTPLMRLDEARNVPLFLAHGRASVTYPVERTCEELRLFHAAGMSVTLRQYPCGDELTSQMLHDMDVWMMEQITGEKMSNAATGMSRPGEAN